MMIYTKDILFKKIKILFLNKRKRREPEALEPNDNILQQVDKALSLGQFSKAYNSRYCKPATHKYVEELAALGIKLDRVLSLAEANFLLGLFRPPSQNQLEILKHFKVKNRTEITRTQANFLIQTIFSDPDNIAQWKHRPPTSKVKQGILFMGGQLNSSMTQIEAQSKLKQYGKENPQRFLEWKHIENIFLSVNYADTLKQHNARKITWKRFFQIYDAIKSSGMESKHINADKIHQHMKQLLLAKERSISRRFSTRKLNISYSGFQTHL